MDQPTNQTRWNIFDGWSFPAGSTRGRGGTRPSHGEGSTKPGLATPPGQARHQPPLRQPRPVHLQPIPSSATSKLTLKVPWPCASRKAKTGDGRRRHRGTLCQPGGEWGAESKRQLSYGEQPDGDTSMHVRVRLCSKLQNYTRTVVRSTRTPIFLFSYTATVAPSLSIASRGFTDSPHLPPPPPITRLRLDLTWASALP